MDITETETSTTDIDTFLASVEMPPQPEPLALDVKRDAEAAAKKAWHVMRAEGKSVDHAREAARIAFENTVELALARARKARLDGAAPAAKPVELKNGFAVPEPLYVRGLQLGEQSEASEVPRYARQGFAKLPPIGDVCTALISKIEGERRAIETVCATDIGMTDQGLISLPTEVLRKYGGELPATLDAFSSMASRLGYGGGSYLSKCETSLRALNINTWSERIAIEEAARAKKAAKAVAAGEKKAAFEPLQIALRTRAQRAGNGERARHIFAAVSPSYAPFDVDAIAKALQIATPADARATLAYDGQKARFNILFVNTVDPKHLAKGETFRVGVSVRGDDTGSGSVKVDVVIESSMCLNLMIASRAAKTMLALRHVGNVYELAARFKAGYAAALADLKPFLAAWNYACEERVQQSSGALAVDMPSSAQEALPGFFNGILEAGLVEIRGNRRAIVEQLCAAWEQDESGAVELGLTRASIVNAFTRFAHEMVTEDPWAEDEIQRQASTLLWGRGSNAPLPLPFEPLEEEKASKSRARGAAVS
jgi:hypothetical protein